MGRYIQAVVTEGAGKAVSYESKCGRAGIGKKESTGSEHAKGHGRKTAKKNG